MPKVLISDSMSNVAQKIFEKNNIAVDVKTGLSEDEIEEGQPVRRAPKMITMDQYRKMSPEEQKMINPEDVLGYVGPDGEDAYGNKPPPSRR